MYNEFWMVTSWFRRCHFWTTVFEHAGDIKGWKNHHSLTLLINVVPKTTPNWNVLQFNSQNLESSYVECR